MGSLIDRGLGALNEQLKLAFAQIKPLPNKLMRVFFFWKKIIYIFNRMGMVYSIGRQCFHFFL